MEQIDAYIAACLEKNIPIETIRANLLQVGWKAEDISSAINKHQQKNAAIVNPPDPSAKVNVILVVDPSVLLLRFGLAFVFTFAAISLSLNPAEGMHYLPSFVTSIIPGKIFLQLFGLYEIALSVWLLSGKWSKYAGFAAAATLFGITSLNLSSFSILFRNVAIFCAALALAVYPEKK